MTLVSAERVEFSKIHWRTHYRFRRFKKEKAAQIDGLGFSGKGGILEDPLENPLLL
jgi:hypothetical protein